MYNAYSILFVCVTGTFC